MLLLIMRSRYSNLSEIRAMICSLKFPVRDKVLHSIREGGQIHQHSKSHYFLCFPSAMRPMKSNAGFSEKILKTGYQI